MNAFKRKPMDMPIGEWILGNILTSTRGCWLWAGRIRNKWGYGEVFHDGKNRQAHRVSFETFKGAIPDGEMVLHRCDTPACVNPDHLFVGSHTDNMRDMAAKGRAGTRRGERNPCAKLSSDKVKFIRSQRRHKGDVSIWAKKMGVSRRAVQFALDGATWK